MHLVSRLRGNDVYSKSPVVPATAGYLFIIRTIKCYNSVQIPEPSQEQIFTILVYEDS